MFKVKVALIVLILGGLALFVLQNLSPALALVILGSRTAALPLAVWILLAIFAGFLTSIALQILNYLQRRLAQRQTVAQIPRSPTSRFSQAREMPKAASRSDSGEARKSPSQPRPEREPSGRDYAATVSDWEASRPPDWNQEDDEWQIEQPPTTETPIQDFPSQAGTYEVKKEAESSDRSGSVYSYRYREAKPKQPKPQEPKPETPPSQPTGEQVYDANYRVIRPPLWEMPNPPDEDEEDWGFDFDDDDEERR